MSGIRLNIKDKNRTIRGEVHGAIGDALIAALSAEPETIGELETGLARFRKPLTDEYEPFYGFAPRENLEPYDAGIIVIDLAARVVAVDSTYSLPLAEGEIRFHDGRELTDFKIPYRLAGDWLFVFSIPEYRGVAGKRLEERLTDPPPLDARKVLYGREMLGFLAGKILAAENLDDENLFADIHAEWLTTSRGDLQNKSPREAMFEKHDAVIWDLQYRELQWSLTGICPPSLPAGSSAVRFAGFGTHEMVIYYDLIRFLLGESLKRRIEEDTFALADEIERLEGLKNAWLNEPNREIFGKSPAEIVEMERRRLPFAVSPGEAMVDDDCEICEMMAADFETPVFRHLDGSHFEDDCFEFSFCETRAEWEAEKRRDEEFSREDREGKR